jgi:hypothetical protein
MNLAPVGDHPISAFGRIFRNIAFDSHLCALGGHQVAPLPTWASRDPTFRVSGWVSSGGFGNLIGGDSGFALEVAGGADGSGEFIRYYSSNAIPLRDPVGYMRANALSAGSNRVRARYVNQRRPPAIRI